jgi:tetratricopeptide (TPR) repeat protein
VAGIVIVFGVYTFIRNQDWNTDERLYASILRVQPEVAHIRNNLADIYMKRGEDALAKTSLETALRSLQSNVYPQAANEKYRAEVGLGALAARGQRYAEAKDHLKQALEINPRGDWAYLYLGGVVMEGDGNYELAMELFKKAIDLGPVNEVARDYMGIALFNMKRYREAIPYFQEALKINPTYKDAQAHLEMTNKALAS